MTARSVGGGTLPAGPRAVAIPSPLRDYTSGAAEVGAAGDTLAAVLADLDRRHPGLRFRIIDEHDRIRPHIWIFIGARMARAITEPLAPGENLKIVAALSGG